MSDILKTEIKEERRSVLMRGHEFKKYKQKHKDQMGEFR